MAASHSVVLYEATETSPERDDCRGVPGRVLRTDPRGAHPGSALAALGWKMTVVGPGFFANIIWASARR